MPRTEYRRVPPAFAPHNPALPHRDQPPVVPSPRGESPARGSNIPSHPRSKSARKQQRGGQP